MVGQECPTSCLILSVRFEIHKVTMKKMFIMVVILLLLFNNGYCNNKWWVFFNDKGSSSLDINSQFVDLKKDWPERSLKRRLMSGVNLSNEDLPIDDKYIEYVLICGAQIVVKSRWMNAVSVIGDNKAIEEIEKLSCVKGVQHVKRAYRAEVELVEISDEELNFNEVSMGGIPQGLYGLSYRQAEQAGVIEAHARGFTGAGVLLGILDTGFQLDHRAFAGMELVAQYDFINNDADPSYDYRTDGRGQPNHGSGCLSVIAGFEPGRLVGIAPKVAVAVGKTEMTGAEMLLEEDYWVAGIEWLEWLGVDVVSSSLSYRDWYGIEDYDGITSVASLAAQRAFELGVVICNSAGNSGPEMVTIGAPADSPGVLAIAAVDSAGEVTGFSSRGPSSDGRLKPDVAAMGRQVVCIRPQTWDKYSRWNGTSLSCPIVAGVVALIREAHPDWTAQEVVTALKETANRSERPDYSYGFGIVNATAAIDYPAISGRIVFAKDNNTDASNQIDNVNLHDYSLVEISLTGKRTVRDVKPNRDGLYVIANLPDDDYRLRVYYDGYKVFDRDGFSLPPTIQYDIVLYTSSFSKM